MSYEFSRGDEVMVIEQEPDPDFLEHGIPVGTHGFYVKPAGTAAHPEEKVDLPTSWVLFDLRLEDHPWASISDNDVTKIEACMFDYMLAPAKDDTFEPGNLEDLL